MHNGMQMLQKLTDFMTGHSDCSIALQYVRWEQASGTQGIESAWRSDAGLPV